MTTFQSHGSSSDDFMTLRQVMQIQADPILRHTSGIPYTFRVKIYHLKLTFI